jgi:hypothetical protein
MYITKGHTVRNPQSRYVDIPPGERHRVIAVHSFSCVSGALIVLVQSTNLGSVNASFYSSSALVWLRLCVHDHVQLHRLWTPQT